MRGDCHWQEEPRKHPTLVLLHGLEGSSESGYMKGCAEKASAAGFNVVRLNQRNCGGTERLTPTLYHSGRSGDFRAVLLELVERDRLPAIFFAGYSMGGNLVLKMAGELGESAPEELRGIVAVAPCLDLAACADALGEPRNFVYNRHFVWKLKARMRRKARMFAGLYSLDGMGRIGSVRDFDETITARFCGFEGADDYYARSSAMHVLAAIRRPTLILTAQDDPFVPFSTFEREAIRENPNIRLVAPRPRRALRVYLGGRRRGAILVRGADRGILRGALGGAGRTRDLTQRTCETAQSAQRKRKAFKHPPPQRRRGRRDNAENDRMPR